MTRDTVCRLCSACCQVEVELKNGKFISAGRKSFLPPKKRIPCLKLQAAGEIIYSPDRLKAPLIREKTSRRDTWREADWEEALELVTEKFNLMKRRYGPESVCWLRGMAADWGAQWDYPNRLMNAFGSPNTIGNGSVCHVARDMGHTYTYGSLTVADAKNAKCVMVWGKNDLNTCPPAGEAIFHAKEKGAKLIVVDPIRTRLAEMADIWLQIKPGHDGLLAMSMINEIVSKRLYDKDFVSDFTTGFESLKTTALSFDTDAVADRIWLRPEQIREVAELYATAKPACIVDGNGIDMQLHVFDATRAICMLRALTGNLDKKGGDLILQPIPMHNIQLRKRLPEDTIPITRDYELFDNFHPTWGRQVQSCVIDAILDEKPYPLKMLVVQSGNPAVTMTDSNRVRKAFEKLDFLVVIDLLMNRTAKFAHVILPASSCFEETQLNRAYMRNSPAVLQNQVIECVGGSMPDSQIVFELARHLGLEKEFPWKTAEEALDYHLAPSGITVDLLRENPNGLRANELRYEKYVSEGFDTPSGKVEFFSGRLKAKGHPPVPFINGPPEDPISFSGTGGDLDMIGISGERTRFFTHTQFRHITSLRNKEPECTVNIHPDDAGERGISEGDTVEISTPRGRVEMKAAISTRMHRECVQIGWGWGEVSSGLSLNNLTDDDQRNPVTGTPSNRAFMCRLGKKT